MQAHDVSYSYDGAAPVLRDVSCAVAPGEFLGILGPNGAGKTTLLKIFAGLLKPRAGTVTDAGMDLGSLSLKERSRRIAYVAQSEEIFLPYTVRQIVLMGRAPYLGLMGFEGPDDHAIVEAAMERTDVARFATRPIQELSGGERQRVFLARALAQQTRVLLLDEPTSHLDLSHQIHFFKLLKVLQGQGLTILATLHDLNLAALFCDRCLLLKDGRTRAFGTPRDVFREDILSDTYGCALAVDPSPTLSVRPLL